MTPLFGLDPALREGDRAAGPAGAPWFVVFVLPLFLFTPDVPKRPAAGVAVSQGLATLGDTLRTLLRRRSTALVPARQHDLRRRLVALFAFGGIYAAGTFGWRTIEIGIFGILLPSPAPSAPSSAASSTTAFGPRPVILGGLGMLILVGIGILSIGRDPWASSSR